MIENRIGNRKIIIVKSKRFKPTVVLERQNLGFRPRPTITDFLGSVFSLLLWASTSRTNKGTPTGKQERALDSAKLILVVFKIVKNFKDYFAYTVIGVTRNQLFIVTHKLKLVYERVCPLFDKSLTYTLTKNNRSITNKSFSLINQCYSLLISRSDSLG